MKRKINKKEKILKPKALFNIFLFRLIILSILFSILLIIKNIAYYDFYIVIPLLLMCAGVFMNFLTIFSNRFRMPVLTYPNDIEINETLHFSFKKKENVKFYYLSDIFSFYLIMPMNTNMHGIKFSIGDIFITIGFFLSFFAILL